MDFFKKSSLESDNHQSVKKSEIENKKEDSLNSTTNSCRSAFRILEATVEDSVNSVVSCGTELVKNVEDESKECVNVIEQGTKIVKDGMDLSEIGVNNIMRLVSVCQNFYHIIAVKYRSYLETDSIVESTMALALWIFICYIFQPWMLPATILVILIKNFIQRQLLGIPAAQKEKMLNEDSEKSITEKLEAVEQIILCVKNILGKVEMVLGKVFEVFDVYLPQLFWITVLIQIVLTAILMYIPINYLIMLWGISLYLKRFFSDKNSKRKPVGIIYNNFPFSIYTKAVPDAILTSSEKDNRDFGDKIFNKQE